MATVMLKLGFILHYEMRSDGCFDMALWVIKLYTVGFYFQFGDDRVDSLLALVSLTILQFSHLFFSLWLIIFH